MRWHRHCTVDRVCSHREDLFLSSKRRLQVNLLLGVWVRRDLDGVGLNRYSLDCPVERLCYDIDVMENDTYSVTTDNASW